MALDEESLEIWRQLPRRPVNWEDLMQDSVGQRIVYALQNDHRLEIIYSGRENPITRRTISPFEAVSVYGLVYIRAYCYLRQGERTFRLDRILAARVIGGPAQYSSEMLQRAIPPTAYQNPPEVDRLLQLSPMSQGSPTQNKKIPWWLILIVLIIIWILFFR